MAERHANDLHALQEQYDDLVLRHNTQETELIAARQRCEELELLLVQGPTVMNGQEELTKRIQELETLITTLETENRQMRRQQVEEPSAEMPKAFVNAASPLESVCKWKGKEEKSWSRWSGKR